jgi:hypothetical protein
MTVFDGEHRTATERRSHLCALRFAAAAQVLGKVTRQTNRQQLRTSTLDIVFHADLFRLNPICSDREDEVSGAGISVFGPPDATGIDEVHSIDDAVVGDVRVPEYDDVCMGIGPAARCELA